MMAVCSRSKVKPKGCPFYLLLFLSPLSTLPPVKFHPSFAYGEQKGFGQWRNGAAEDFGETLPGFHLLLTFCKFSFCFGKKSK
jgi:hypothetical protein